MKNKKINYFELNTTEREKTCFNDIDLNQKLKEYQFLIQERNRENVLKFFKNKQKNCL